MEQMPLDESTWSGGLKPTDYFQSLENYKHLVLSLYRDATVEEADGERIAAALPGAPADLRISVLTEDWCGDSATTLPYIARISELLDVEMRVFRQSRNTVLKQWYVDRDTEHIPVVSLARRGEEGWVEVMRWVERPASAHGRVKSWVENQPRFLELRRRKDEDPEAAKEYFNLYARLLREMASWYRNGLWAEISREFAERLHRSA